MHHALIFSEILFKLFQNNHVVRIYEGCTYSPSRDGLAVYHETLIIN